jgi:CubicO group peptidase (beta-lactamase class C family)
MFSTVDDMLRLGRTLLDDPAGPYRRGGSPRILSRRAIGMMGQPQLDGLTHLAADGTPTTIRQALGWRKPAGAWPDRPSAITHGGISGARLWVDRDAGLAFALLTNLWHAPEEPIIGILDAVYRARP